MTVNAFLPPFVGWLPLYGLHYYGGILLFLAWVGGLRAPYRRPAALGLVGAVVGGWALSHWTLGRHQGLYAAALGAAAFLLPLSRQGGWDWKGLGDRAVVPLALSFACMKLGCLAGGCCLGGPHSGPWVARYSAAWPVVPRVLQEHPHWEGVALYPAPLYAVLLSLTVAAGVGIFRPFLRDCPGASLMVGVVTYGVGRALLDGVSGTPSAWVNGGVGLLFLVLMTGVWISDSILGRHSSSGI